MIEDRIKKEKELIKRLNLHIKCKEREEISMDYQIEHKRKFARSWWRPIRYNKGGNTAWWTNTYGNALIKRQRETRAGAPSSVNHDAEYKEDGADLELCLPIRRR
jgi:hypothetical protein